MGLCAKLIYHTKFEGNLFHIVMIISVLEFAFDLSNCGIYFVKTILSGHFQS